MNNQMNNQMNNETKNYTNSLINMGLNPNLLDEDLMYKLESIFSKINKKNIKPDEIFNIMKNNGINVQELYKKMRVKGETKTNKNKVKRNGKCDCGSNKKSKKCCYK